MSKSHNFLKNHSLSIGIIILFLITRAFIWFNPPRDFTEIIYSYMPYAHLWASGVRPYLDQWYEYPPITIPLFYLPHLIDKLTYQSLIPINYANAYRGLMFLIDTGLFILVWKILNKLKVKTKLKLISLIYYCLITAKANHFLYDTMDWAFAAALVFSVAFNFKTNFNNSLKTWIGYWLAVGLKLLNGPLGLPLALLKRLQRKTSWIAMVIACGLVLGLPILVYRSSLSVMFLFHQIRGLQVDSFVAIIVRVINSFTKTESIIEIYKNYEMVGPVTTQALSILSIIFPVALVVYILWVSKQAWRLASQPKKHSVFYLSITLGFVLLLMIVSKVLSRPFVLWHIPLLAILPVKTLKEQLRFLIPSVLAVGLTLTGIPDIALGIFNTPLLVGVIRTLSFLWLFIEWFRWHIKHFPT